MDDGDEPLPGVHEFPRAKHPHAHLIDTDRDSAPSAPEGDDPIVIEDDNEF